jgi:hypothetical protein
VRVPADAAWPQVPEEPVANDAVGEPAFNAFFHLSLDGRRVVVTRGSPIGTDLWMLDVRRVFRAGSLPSPDLTSTPFGPRTAGRFYFLPTRRSTCFARTQAEPAGNNLSPGRRTLNMPVTGRATGALSLRRRYRPWKPAVVVDSASGTG